MFCECFQHLNILSRMLEWIDLSIHEFSGSVFPFIQLAEVSESEMIIVEVKVLLINFKLAL